jgi:hypothetical protein
VEELVVVEVARDEYRVALDGVQQMLVIAVAYGSSVLRGRCCVAKPAWSVSNPGTCVLVKVECCHASSNNLLEIGDFVRINSICSSSDNSWASCRAARRTLACRITNSGSAFTASSRSRVYHGYDGGGPDGGRDGRL